MARERGVEHVSGVYLNPFEETFEVLETTATIQRENERHRLVVRRVKERLTGKHFVDVRVFIPRLSNPGATKHGLTIASGELTELIDGLAAVEAIWEEAGVINDGEREEA